MTVFSQHAQLYAHPSLLLPIYKVYIFSFAKFLEVWNSVGTLGTVRSKEKRVWYRF